MLSMRASQLIGPSKGTGCPPPYDVNPILRSVKCLESKFFAQLRRDVTSTFGTHLLTLPPVTAKIGPPLTVAPLSQLEHPQSF